MADRSDYHRKYLRDNRAEIRERTKAWRASNPERVAEYNRKNRLRAYGLSVGEFKAMFEKQGGLCPLCQQPLGEGVDGAQVDHDHKTQAVRGLLCRPCNIGLGNFCDSVDRLQRAIDYLSK